METPTPERAVRLLRTASGATYSALFRCEEEGLRLVARAGRVPRSIADARDIAALPRGSARPLRVGRRLVGYAVVPKARANPRFASAVREAARALRAGGDAPPRDGPATGPGREHGTALGAIVASLSRYVPKASAYVALWDRATGMVRFPYYYEGSRRDHMPDRPFANGLTEHVIRTGETLHIRRDFEREVARRKIRYLGTASKSWLGTPLLADGRAFGVLAVYDNDREEAFGPDDERLLESLAAMASLALRNAEALREMEGARARLRSHQEALLHLARESVRLDDASAALARVAEEAAATLHVERVGIWLLERGGTRFRCVDLFERSKASHSSGIEFTADEQPAYFAAMEANRTIVAPHAEQDPRTRGFRDGYLRPFGIGSLLDVPIRVGGRLVGVVCHEHVGPPRDWSPDDERFASSIGDLAALVLERSEKLRAEEEVRLLEAISLSVAAAPGLAEALRVALRILCEETAWGLGQAWLPNPAGDALEPSEAWHLADGGLRAFREASEAETFAADVGSLGTSWSRARPVWSTLRDEPSQARAAAARAAGADTALAVPVMSGGKVSAVLELVGRGMHREDDRLVSLVVAVAAHLGSSFERKRAEDALRRQEQLHAAMLRAQSAAGEGFAVLDGRRRRLLYANEAVSRMTGFSSEELLASPDVLAFVPAALREQHLQRLERRLAGEDVEARYETVLQRKDGSTFDADVVVQPLFDEDRAWIVALVRDVTERRRTEARIAEIRARHQEVVENVPAGVLYLDRDGNGAFENAYLLRMLGAPDGETLRGKGPVGAILDGLSAEAKEAIAGTLRGKTFRDLVSPFRTPWGKDLVVQFSGVPVREESTDGAGAALLFRDVTEEKRLEAELRSHATDLERIVEHRTRDLVFAKANLETVFESTVDGFLFVDKDLNLVSANRRFCEFFGLSIDEILHGDKDEVRAKARARYVDPASFDETRAAYTPERRHLATTAILELVDGRVLHEHSAPVFADGVYTGRVWTYHDITDRKRLEDELVRHAATLEAEVDRRTSKLLHAAKMAALGQLVAGVAHEINNPLAFVKSNTAVLREEYEELANDPVLVEAFDGKRPASEALDALRTSKRAAFWRDEVRRILDVNLRGLTRISDIVYRLRTFAAPQIPRKEPTNLADLLRDTSAIFLAQFADRVRVEETFEDLPPVVCDGGQIGQVVMNLLVNAGQAIEGSGTVRLGLRREKSFAVLTVEDDGTGMPPEVRSRIFDPFYTTKATGTGLGLSISYAIVREHGGEIVVESEPGKGTRMVVRIPMGDAP